MSIEVLDGKYPARLWVEAHGDSLIEAAIYHGATDWRFHDLRWGVVLELGFADSDQWDAFRADAGVEAALDAVPNPDGLLIYRGWGGSSWPREPRRPRPLAGAGAAALPIPEEWTVVEAPPAPLPRVLISR
ncbi:MAG: hypothetical protein AB1673_09510 [Actinomycetota bacterium]